LKHHSYVFAIALAVIAGEVSAFQIESVPFVKQDRQQCGPASLASVLSFYGVSVQANSVSEVTYDPRIGGSLITDLENFARRLGFRTESGQGTVEKVKGFINQKMPVIVLIDLGFWLASKPHYLVLFGYTEKGFIAHDGERASKIYDYSEFGKKWDKMGNTYLLIYR
jgi:ABC-type bacteriocin/lantibiotic exporter with double-glycine peptidase domain